jgi:hypothetical protein
MDFAIRGTANDPTQAPARPAALMKERLVGRSRVFMVRSFNFEEY